MGLITGDQAGNFNGSNTMMRNELATVIDRLAALKTPGESTANPGTTSESEKPIGTEQPADSEKPEEKAQTTEEYLAENQSELTTYSFQGTFRKTDHDIGRPAYDKHTYGFSDVPYKVYYTMDGGKTSVLIAEGITGSDDNSVYQGLGKAAGTYAVDVQLPKDAFSPPNSDQKGIYISAEAELDGQKLVTSDLRTDGRAYVTPWHLSTLNVELTPPTGEKAIFSIKGRVGYGMGIASSVGEGFTVQLHLKDGRVVAETSTDASGHYTLICEVDALDNGFNTKIEQYYITASGVQDGTQMEYAGTRSNGELALYSSEFMGGDPHSRTYSSVSWGIEVFPVK